MVSIQSRVNSTERKRITRDHVTIALDPPADTNSFSYAYATVDLNGLDFPRQSDVVLEAYYRTSSMRFACGKVEMPEVPSRMELSDIDVGGAIQFRLLIIEPSRGASSVRLRVCVRPKGERVLIANPCSPFVRRIWDMSYGVSMLIRGLDRCCVSIMLCRALQDRFAMARCFKV